MILFLKKLWGYEPAKVFHSPYVILGGIALIVANTSYFIWIAGKLSVNYLHWLRVSNSRHVFDYLLGKTAFFNGGTLLLIILLLAYLIFFSEYKRGAIERITYSLSGVGSLFRQKILFFAAATFAFMFAYLLQLGVFGYYLIGKYPDLLAGQQKHVLGALAEYLVVYLLFAIRSAFLFSIFSKIFKADFTAWAVLVLLHLVGNFISLLPFCLVYTTDMTFERTVLPAIFYTVLFYFFHKKLFYAY